MPALRASLVVLMKATSFDGPIYRHLTLVHIPKTGGTAILQWAATQHLNLEEPRTVGCNVSKADGDGHPFEIGRAHV